MARSPNSAVAVMWLIQFKPARENACSQTDVDDKSSLTQGIRTRDVRE